MAKDRNIGNKRPENHKEYTKFYGGGISADNTNEIAGVVNQDKYLRGKNIRVSSKKNSSAAERIGGERLIHTYAEDNERYICILETNINSHKVTIWASIDWSETSPTNGVMAIDDTVMLSSDKFPVRHIHPFDHDKNENCLGGELYITNNNLPPMYFNIQDIIDNFNAGTDKYFEGFDYMDYIINLKNSLNSLVFVELVNVGAGNGRPVGQESYSYRLVSNDGDRTNWSVSTPLIPIPSKLVSNQNDTDLYKYESTIGADSDSESRTVYSPLLKLRIDNQEGYDYIEVRRTSYNGGEGLGYTPQSYIFQKINIYDNQFGVIEIIDSKNKETDSITLSNEDLLDASVMLKRAEAIRYFKNKVVLLNIEYKKIDVDSIDLTYRELYSRKGEPVLKYLDKAGYKDIYNNVYFKSKLNGERYSYSIVLWNTSLQKTFVLPIDWLDNFKYPDKRKSIDGFPGAEEVSEYLNGLHDSINPFDSGPFFELPSQDTNEVEKVFEVSRSIKENEYVTIYPHTGLDINIGQTDKYKYRVRKPVRDTDNDFSGRNIGSVSGADSGTPFTYSATTGWIDSPYDSQEFDIVPEKFSPPTTFYQSLGLAIHGISNFPEWCSAFSIARTKPANRVVAQGLAMYPLEEKGQTMGETYTSLGGFNIFEKNPAHEIDETLNDAANPQTSSVKPVYGLGKATLRPARKSAKNKIHVAFPDIDSGIIGFNTIESIIKNPSGYKIQFVEPLGFYTAPFNGDAGSFRAEGIDPESVGEDNQRSADLWHEKIDMVTFAKVQDQSTGLPSLLKSDYAYFGGNRNEDGFDNVDTLASTWLGGQLASANGFTSQIVSISIKTDNIDDITYLEIELEDDVWNNQDTCETAKYEFNQREPNQELVKLWHEHIYAVNIIRDEATVAITSNQDYLMPINFIKLNSKVGIAYGAENEYFECVDERKEDYSSYDGSSLINFIYIKRGGEEFRFINITDSAVYADIATIDSDIDNGTTIYCGEVIHGKYKVVENKIHISDLFSYTVATIASKKLQKYDEVYVRYDNTKPISVFGGDVVTSDANFVYKHRESIAGGIHQDPYVDLLSGIRSLDLSAFGSQFMLGIGFPHFSFRRAVAIRKAIYYLGAIPDEVSYPRDMDSGYGRNTQDPYWILNFIRQWIFLYTCQSRYNLALAYGEFYPNRPYKERPLCWDVTKLTVQENKIALQYETDYPLEISRWTTGGFGVSQFNDKNLDYSKEPEHDKLIARALFLQNNETRFCTRVIWSQTRPIQSFNAPNLKTFRPFNYKDISDKFGDGRKLFISSDRYGDNLYAFCENDIALLLVSKRTLSDASGNIIGTTGNSDSQFINQEEWQNIGAKKGLQKLHKWTWAEDGNRAFYANKNGVFMFEEGQDKVKDITDGNRESIINEVQESFGNLFKRTVESGRNIVELECLGYGFYDNKFNEYGFITKLPVVVANDMCFDTPEETNNNYYDITDCNNILFEILYNDEFSDEVFLKLIENSPLDIALNKSFYIRKVVAQDVTVRIYEDATSTLTEHILDAGDEYFKITRTVVAVNEFENDAEWSVQVINKETLENVRNVFVYCTRENVKAWVSENEYIFDKIQTSNGKKYGFRNMKCYELESGNILNGEYIKAEIIDVINPDKEDIEQEKEFVRIQVNTQKELEEQDKLSIDFLKDNQDTIHSSISGDNMNKYGGYTNYIPRNPDTSKRYQDNKILFRIMYDGKDNISITSVDIQYKILK